MPFYFCDNHGVYQYDKELQTVPKKNVELRRLKDYLEEYKTNKYGTINFQDDFSGYHYLVFTLGDSYTQGVGIATDASYPFQLDLLLNIENNEYTFKYGVVNLGLASYGGEQYLLALKRYLKLIGKPDFILVLGCSNDYADDLRFKDFQSGKTFDIIEGNPKVDWFMKPLIFLGYDTEIGKRLYWMIKNYQKISFKKSNPGLKQKEICAAEREAPVYEELNIIAKENHARLIISWASRDESYDWMKQWAQSHQIPFADWYPAVQSVMKNIPALPLGNPHSGGHYRTWVNKIIAESFARCIHNLDTGASPARISAQR
jgi:lysophospholipase L1-like esterase